MGSVANCYSVNSKDKSRWAWSFTFSSTVSWNLYVCWQNSSSCDLRKTGWILNEWTLNDCFRFSCTLTQKQAMISGDIAFRRSSTELLDSNLSTILWVVLSVGLSQNRGNGVRPNTFRYNFIVYQSMMIY